MRRNFIIYPGNACDESLFAAKNLDGEDVLIRCIVLVKICGVMDCNK